MFKVTMKYGKDVGCILTIENKVVTDTEPKNPIVARRAFGDNPFNYKGLLNRIKTLYGSSVHFDDDDDYLRKAMNDGNVRNDLDPSVVILVEEF